MDKDISVVLWIISSGYVVNKEVADFTFLSNLEILTLMLTKFQLFIEI